MYETLIQELRFEDELEYKKLLRLTPQDFDEILGLIQDGISKLNTNMLDSIPADVKLAAIIWFLATGDIHTNLQYHFRVHANALSKFLPEACDAIYRKFKDEYLGVSILPFII